MPETMIQRNNYKIAVVGLYFKERHSLLDVGGIYGVKAQRPLGSAVVPEV